MTTARLVARVNDHRYFADRKIQIRPSEVYAAGDDAQREICTECEVLESYITVALAASQEFYSPPASSVKAVSLVEDVVTLETEAAHQLLTGDSVAVFDVGGDADGDQTVTVVNTVKVKLNGCSTLPSSYLAGTGSLYHRLFAMVRPKGRVAILYDEEGAVAGEVHRIDQQVAENYKWRVGVSGKPLYFWTILGSRPQVALLPTPNDTYTMKIRVCRKPYPAEVIDVGKNPVIDSDYDRALYTGTLYYVLSQYKREPGAAEQIAEALRDFELAKNAASIVRAKREFTADVGDVYDLKAPG